MLEHLFSPFRIRNCNLANRIVMPGLASFLIEDDGSITDKTIEHYKMRAGGGLAMVIVEACAVSPEGIVSPHQARIYDDRFVHGLSRIAAVVKAEGCVAAVQLHHGGRQTPGKVIGQKPVAPSPIPCPTISGEVEALSVAGIQELVWKFGEAATRALQAGFELIEIHGAHGYLVNQFLSRFSNIREDEYGGDMHGRTRFAVETVREVRKRVKEDFPLSFKISAREFVPEGLTLEESIQALKILIPHGIDVVQVSAGNDATPEWICQPMFMPKGCLVESAAAIRRELQIPVMAVGRINEPLLADTIIREGKADLVCVGRGILADPEMPRKAREGRMDEIRTCIACNTCMESIFRRGRVECLVNPALGREREMTPRPTATPKKVMVIGGGPGGLQAACMAARRGHDVSLYERAPRFGGQLNMGSITWYKKELVSLIAYQRKQIEKAGVKAFLNCEATPESILEQNPDVVILCTGSVPIKPALPGIDNPIVFMPPEVLNGKKRTWKNTVVIGGGATGCEVAHYLAEQGCEVTIVEQFPKIAGQMESITRKVLLQELEQKKVRMLTECTLSRIEERGLFLTRQGGKESFLPADAVIVAIGNRPDNTLYDRIKTMGIPIHRIGDCLEARSAKTAIYEGTVIGLDV